MAPWDRSGYRFAQSVQRFLACGRTGLRARDRRGPGHGHARFRGQQCGLFVWNHRGQGEIRQRETRAVAGDLRRRRDRSRRPPQHSDDPRSCRSERTEGSVRVRCQGRSDRRNAQYRACRRRGLSRRGLERPGGRRTGCRRGTAAPDQRRTCYRDRAGQRGSRRQPEEEDERQKRIRRRGCAMNISEFCVRHPVATTLMSAALVTAGFFAYFLLPVAALPRTEFPVVNVSASLPGASPDTMANAVATPLIKQFSTISGIDTISATSALSSTSIAIQFNLDRDIDSAAADVQSAIARVQRRLPTEMTEPPSYRKVNPADAPILILTLRSDLAPLPEMDAFAQQVISPALSTIDGVAQVTIFGSQKYAVRVQLDPDTLAARGIGVDEVQAAVSAANANTPVGTLKNKQQSLTLLAQTELSNGDQFRSIIVAMRNGRPVRLGELATVTDSVQDNQTASWHNGTRAILLAVYRQPEANTVDVVNRVRALLPSFDQ